MMEERRKGRSEGSSDGEGAEEKKGREWMEKKDQGSKKRK